MIPDYLDAENILVADAKYIPLHRFDRMDAERAAAVYYKTIMYMYRFNATKGFLFHPCNLEDINYIKEDKEKSLPFTINEGLVSSDYKIVDTEGYLYELGMIIPNADNYETFCDNMRNIETQYKDKIQEYINPPD